MFQIADVLNKSCAK